MKKLLLALALVAMSTPCYAGYFLALSRGNATAVVPYEYQDKISCEQAAKVAEERWYTSCIPTDTHVSNLEFD